MTAASRRCFSRDFKRRTAMAKARRAVAARKNGINRPLPRYGPRPDFSTASGAGTGCLQVGRGPLRRASRALALPPHSHREAVGMTVERSAVGEAVVTVVPSGETSALEFTPRGAQSAAEIGRSCRVKASALRKTASGAEGSRTPDH